MTRHGPALLALSVIAIAGWAYNINYDTRAALDRLSGVRGEIGEAREALQVLRVEWAYLNAPDRLAALVARHNDALGLVPLVPENLGYVAAIPYPPREAPGVVPEPPEALIATAPAAAPAAVPAAVPTGSSAATQPTIPAGARVAVAGTRPRTMPAEPAPSARAVAPAGARQAADAAREAVPPMLEAAIADALAEVGVATDGPRPAGPRSGVIAVPADAATGFFAASAPGVPVPAVRPVAWSRP